MKKFNVFLAMLLLNSFCTYCQLLSNPFLNVEDVEIALSNPDHLRNILRDHGFAYEVIKGKTNQPGALENPLFSEKESDRTEYWKPKLNKTSSSNVKYGVIRSVSIIDWKSNYGPYPNVIKSITFMINQDPLYASKVDPFFLRIKDRYPSKAQRYIGTSEQQRAFSEPINVFVNNRSKIEVQMSQGQVGSSKNDVSSFYIVSFNLIQ